MKPWIAIYDSSSNPSPATLALFFGLYNESPAGTYIHAFKACHYTPSAVAAYGHKVIAALHMMNGNKGRIHLIDPSDSSTNTFKDIVQRDVPTLANMEINNIFNTKNVHARSPNSY